MRAPRFSLRILLLVITAVCLAAGYARFQERRVEFASAFYGRTVSSISLAFNKMPPGCEAASFSWPGQGSSDFDHPDYSVWQRELQAESQLKGTHEAQFYKTNSLENAQAREELARVLLNHFAIQLYSMGFVTANDGLMVQHSVGHQKVVTLKDPQTGLGVIIRLVFGRKGFTFVAIEIGDG